MGASEALQDKVEAARLNGEAAKASVLLGEFTTKLCKRYSEKDLVSLGNKLLKTNAEATEKLEVAWALDTKGHLLSAGSGISGYAENAAEFSNYTSAVTSSPEAAAEGQRYIELGLALRKQCLEAGRSSGVPDTKVEVLVARSLSSLALLYHAQGRVNEADATHLEALTLFDTVQLHICAMAASKDEEYDQADEEEESDSGEEDIEDGEGDWLAFMESKLESVGNKLVQEASDGLFDNIQDKLFNRDDQEDGVAERILNKSQSCRLVLVRKPARGAAGSLFDPSPVTPSIPFECGALPSKEVSAAAQRLDSEPEHVPRMISLSPSKTDVVQFGRQSYVGSLEHFQHRMDVARPSQRKYGWIRLDSPLSEKQVSRRHAQLRFSRVHGAGSNTTASVANDSFLRSERCRSSSQQGDENSTPKATSKKLSNRVGKDVTSTSEQFGMAWVIKDLDSTNGILVNGVRVLEYVLKHGDLVSFGAAGQIAFGASINTQKRLPAESPFLYRFEVLPTSISALAAVESQDANSSSSSSSSSRVGRPKNEPGHSNRADSLDAMTLDRPSLLSLFVDAYLIKKQQKPGNQSALADTREALELLHFQLLFASVHTTVLSEKTKQITAFGDAASSAEMQDLIDISTQLFYEANQQGIPGPYWWMFLRNKMGSLR